MWHVHLLKPAFSQLSGIISWTVDIQDVDKVLKIVTLEDSREEEFIDLVKNQGFRCEPLPD